LLSYYHFYIDLCFHWINRKQGVLIVIIIILIMIQANLERHPGFAWMMLSTLWWQSHHNVGFATRHPGSNQMMVAKRPRHGFAMTWASPTCHPGSARMSWRLCRHDVGFAHTSSGQSPDDQYYDNQSS
jgi:hypothetical protein